MEAIKLDGFLLSFTPSQYKAVKKFLEENDYPGDSDGLKECILDLMDQSRADRPGEVAGKMVADFIRSNPQVVSAGLGVGVKVIGGMLKLGRMKR